VLRPYEEIGQWQAEPASRASEDEVGGLVRRGWELVTPVRGYYGALGELTQKMEGSKPPAVLRKERGGVPACRCAKAGWRGNQFRVSDSKFN
jgi:hypothetical protein